MSVRISRTSSTTVSSTSSKTNNVSKSNSKTSSSKTSSSSKSSSKTNSSKTSGSSKSSNKTSSSKTSSLSKSSSKTLNSVNTNSKASSGKTSSVSSIKIATQNTNRIDGSTEKVTSNSNMNSKIHSSVINTISGVKYIKDAPAIYTKQALKSSLGSSVTSLAKTTHKDYVPGMPSSDYEKYKKSLEPKFNGKTSAINNMLNNIDKDKSLKLSDDKKAAMLVAGEKLLNKGYEAKFVAGVLGNIMNEGTAGKFESSNYKSNPESEPNYLKYMDEKFNYRKNFSGKSISEVGIKETIALQEKVEATKHYNESGKAVYKGKFGLGTCQFTGSRTTQLLDSYKDYYNKTHDNNPSKENCIKIEVDFMISELDGSYNKLVYQAWKSGSKTASSAGKIVCEQYEKPKDIKNQSKERGENATKIYNIMKK